jgi:6-pyruvoyltetrahydropterin/6-carboxytetrahydropterin synthase
LAIKFWEVLEPKISKGRLHEIKLYESERNYVVYRGDCL